MPNTVGADAIALPMQNAMATRCKPRASFKAGGNRATTAEAWIKGGAQLHPEHRQPKASEDRQIKADLSLTSEV